MASSTCRRGVALLLGFVAGAPGGAAGQELPGWLHGEFRVRSEWDRRVAGAGADVATLLRTRLGIRGDVGPSARLFVQLQDSRAFGEEEGTLADASADRIDLHQGWGELHGRVGGVPVALRAGRQEIVLGTERLVGAVGWSNTGRSFDGVRLDVGPGAGRWGLTALATTIDERDRVGAGGLDPRRNRGVDDDHAFLGLYVRLPRAGAAAADLFLLHDRNGREPGAEGIDRTTAGGRVAGTAGAGLQYEAEAGFQFGARAARPEDGPATAQDIEAWFAAGRLGWSAPDRRLRRLRVGIDWLSGDPDPTDAEFRVFDTLYATNHKFYGLMDLFLDPGRQTGGRGLVDGVAEASVGAGRAAAVDLALHRFRTARRRGPEARTIGTELDVTLRYAADEGVSLTGGYSLFVHGDAAPLAGLSGASGDAAHWAYLQATLSF